MKKYRFALIQILIIFNIITYGQSSSIVILHPEQGDQITIGENTFISWSIKGIKSVRIDYKSSTLGEWNEIASSVTALQNIYSWQVPNLTSDMIILRIMDQNNKDNFAIINLSTKISDENAQITKLDKKASTNQNQIKIMPLGNSITRGSSGSPDKIGYRRQLYQNLINDGYNIDFVGSNSLGLIDDFDKDHEGHSGWHAKHPTIPEVSIANNLYDWLELNPPNIILLHAGTNDIIGLEGNNETTSDVVDDITEILNIVDSFETNYNTEIFVVLARIILQENDTVTSSYNLGLDSLSSIRILDGDKLILVDQESALEYPADLDDGIHPNQTGYNKMADVWYNALKSLIGQKPLIVNQPESQGVIEGDSVTFKIAASGSDYLKYQWRRNGIDIPGATDSVLTISNISILENNDLLSCNVYNLIDSTLSNEAILYVTDQENRVTGGEFVFYDFKDNGNEILDKAVLDDSLNLLIENYDSTLWLSNGLKITPETKIISENPAKKIYDKCLPTNEFTLEIWVATDNINQLGFQDIINYSGSSDSTNFRILQNSSKYDFKTKTSSTFPSGESILSQSDLDEYTIMHIVFTRSFTGLSKLFINGSEENYENIPGYLSNWDSTYYFSIGNIFNNQSPWTGALFQLSIFDRDLSPNEIYNNFNIGLPGTTDLIAPSNLQLSELDYNKVSLAWEDNTQNEKGFIIERLERGLGDYIVLDSTETDVNYYLDSTNYSGIKYSYRVKAYVDYFNTEASSSESITLSLPSPSELECELNPSDFVNLTWQDNSLNELGFIIEGRPSHPDSNFIIIDTVSSNIIEYEDITPKFFTPYEYRISAFTLDTVSNYSNNFEINVVGIESHTDKIPEKYELFQNYPNPFNPTTNIMFSLPSRSNVNLTLYNILGQSLLTLIDEIIDHGVYKTTLNTTGLSSGVYFYALNAKSTNSSAEFKKVIKLIIQK